jgi:tRNA(Ile)-lysidine synthase
MAFKEYDYITLTNKQKNKVEFSAKWGLGETEVNGFGSIIVRRTQKLQHKAGELVLDGAKVPKDAVWRFKERGDMFEKFGGGTKKLKDFLIDKKIPNRLRENLPVLASGKNVLAVAGIEISSSVRVDENTKQMYKIITKKC